MQCYSCGHFDEDCTMNNFGQAVYCQTDNPENPNYGDTCYVGHSGELLIFKINWFQWINLMFELYNGRIEFRVLML